MTTALIAAVAVICFTFEFIVIVLLLRHMGQQANFIMAQKDVSSYAISHPEKPRELTEEELAEAAERKAYDEFKNILLGGTISDAQESRYAAPDITVS